MTATTTRTTMKRSMATALILTATITTAACSGPTIPAPPERPLASPDTRQTQDLTAAVLKINPVLANDKLVENSREICEAMWSGTPEDRLISHTQEQFTGGEVKDVPPAEARAIIEAIRANSFCPASPQNPSQSPSPGEAQK